MSVGCGASASGKPSPTGSQAASEDLLAKVRNEVRASTKQTPARLALDPAGWVVEHEGRSATRTWKGEAFWRLGDGKCGGQTFVINQAKGHRLFDVWEDGQIITGDRRDFRCEEASATPLVEVLRAMPDATSAVRELVTREAALLAKEAPQLEGVVERQGRDASKEEFAVDGGYCYFVVTAGAWSGAARWEVVFDDTVVGLTDAVDSESKCFDESKKVPLSVSKVGGPFFLAVFRNRETAAEAKERHIREAQAEVNRRLMEAKRAHACESCGDERRRCMDSRGRGNRDCDFRYRACIETLGRPASSCPE